MWIIGASRLSIRASHNISRKRETVLQSISREARYLSPARKGFALTNVSIALFQSAQLYAPHPAGYPQVSPPTSLQYMGEPGAVLGSSVIVSVFRQ